MKIEDLKVGMVIQLGEYRIGAWYNGKVCKVIEIDHPNDITLLECSKRMGGVRLITFWAGQPILKLATITTIPVITTATNKTEENYGDRLLAFFAAAPPHSCPKCSAPIPCSYHTS